MEIKIDIVFWIEKAIHASDSIVKCERRTLQDFYGPGNCIVFFQDQRFPLRTLLICAQQQDTYMYMFFCDITTDYN